MIPTHELNDLDLFCWEQDQFQIPLDMPPCEQCTSGLLPYTMKQLLSRPVHVAALYFSDWDTDHSARPDFFTEDTTLAAGLSDPLQDGSPLLHQLGAGGNPSNITQPVSPDQPSFNTTMALPADYDSVGERQAARPDIKLRSASQKPKRSPRRKPVGPKQEVHSRECHNLVEKQYRIRLKAQFEALLAVLPVSQSLENGDGTGRGSPGQCFSRGQVLDAARGRILLLEKELEEMASLRDELLRDLSCLQQVLKETGLECLD